MFNILTSKIFGGLAIALALFALVQTVRLGNARDTIRDKQEVIDMQASELDTLAGNLARCDAAVEAQNDAVAAQAAKGEQSAMSQRKALKRAENDNRKADESIRRVQARPVNACETGADVATAVENGL